jgi:hypothetical protein
VQHLDRAKKAVDAFSRAQVDAGQIDLAPQCDRVRSRLDALSGRIGGAMQGYSGMFDLVQIDEEVLDRVYQCAADLTDRVERLADAAAQLPSAAKPADALADLLTRAGEIDQSWNERNNILKGLA